MQFSYWPILFLILLVPLFHRFWSQRNRPAAIRFPLSIPPEISQKTPYRALLILKYVGLILILVALARPQNAHKDIHRQVSGIDIMMVMDLSASMNIEDLAERSRLDVAKDTIRNFIEGRQNDRIGFVVFSGEPLTLAPPTLDYGLVLKSIRDAQIGILKDGTAIGDGLALAVNRLRDSKAKSRVIILLTDGDNNVGQLDPATAGELASGYGIRVYTIAIGREGRVKLPIRHKGPFGQVITSYQWFDNALNPKLLKQIASDTGGKFYRVTDASTLDSVFSEINELEKSDVKTDEKIRYEELYDKPLKIGFLFLIAGSLLGWGWWRILP